VSSRHPLLPDHKFSVLLMDINAERRKLRTRIMGLHGLDVIVACDLTEASLFWHRDRYDMVLMDIRADHRGCIELRDEIKKQQPGQIVGFLVGGPKFVDLEPAFDSYVHEEHGSKWGDSLRQAVRESCASLPQRNGFVEASWRISLARKAKPAHSPKPPDAGSLEILALEPIDPAGASSEGEDEPSGETSRTRPDVEFQW
jgi:CheY-like chemotaxis protein